MSRNHKIFVIVIALALAALACSVVSSSGDNTSTSSSQSNNVLFQDDFSNPNSGWDRQEYDGGITDYGDNVYTIQIFQDNYSAWATAYKDFTNVEIQVETYKDAGGDDNGFGIICRHLDVDNFYFLEISSDGYAWIGKNYQGQAEALNNTQTAAINQGNDSNKIKAICDGDYLALYVNGKMVIDARDSDIPHGDVGLIAETYTAKSTEILFDNFIVTKP